MSDKKLRVFKLRTSSDEELLKGLDEYKKELNNLRTLKITGGTSAKLGKIRVCEYLCLMALLFSAFVFLLLLTLS